MDDDLAKGAPKIQADNQSIAIGEINITGTVTGNITIGHTIVQPADARLRHELGILLKNVQTTWIQGVLEKSVHEAALLELGVELREEAVDNPWRMVIEGPDQTQQTLPRGRKIKDIFDEANRLLLILGEPGSGKTTTLLQLARDLIAEVDAAFTQPVPVILNLSTWTNKQQPLAEWLVAELNSKYRLPKKDGQRWLKERRILPLLDGLDEVRAENRAACVEKINLLVTDYGLQGMIVCSRIKDYTALDVRLAFYRAIYIQPLSPEQVDEYLERAGDKLASLRATLQADLALRNMAQSPLILNVMSLAYQNISAEDLSDSSLNTDKARRKHLFNTYVARMFKRRAGMQVYKDEQTKQRLSWLTRNMQRHNQEVFLIEGLQPSWLLTHRSQWAYFFASRLAHGLSFVLFVPLVGGWLVSISEWLTLGLAAGLFVGFVDFLRCDYLRKRRAMRKFPVFWWSVINIVIVGLIFGLMYALIYGLIHGYAPNADLSFLLLYCLLYGLLFGLIFGIRGSRQSAEIDIEPVEMLRWSWREAAKGGLIGGIFGLLVTLIYSRSLVVNDWLDYMLDPGLRFGLSFGLIGVFLNGLRREIIETKSSPNQSIRLSIRNAIVSGLIIGLIVVLGDVIYQVLYLSLSLGLRIVLDLVLRQGPSSVLGIQLENGLSVGLLGALWYGGFDIIQHYTLRLILLIQGHTPANYARFLDYAVDRIFLQKVGGGYRFIHRLLLEHFAEMGEAKKV
jgi:eukaryotic-like serine/threonine-protein kinase